MSDHEVGEGWWLATDGRWYPPEMHPDLRRRPGQGSTAPSSGPVPVPADEASPLSGPARSRTALVALLVLLLVAAVGVGTFLVIGDDNDGSGGTTGSDGLATAEPDNDTTDPSTGETSGSATSTTIGPEHLFSVTDTATVGSWEIAIGRVDLDAADEIVSQSTDRAPPPAGTRYVLVEVTATYRGDRLSSNVSDLDFVALSDTHQYSGFAEPCGSLPESLNRNQDVAPGESVTGTVCFAVAEGDATGLMLSVQDFFAGPLERVTFVLKEI